MQEISLYVHIPFCKQKCLYCDFPSYAGKENLEDDYIDALIKEINRKCKNKVIRSLFIGGGTPSYLKDSNIEKLLKTMKKLNYIDKFAEKTMECNPGTLTKEKLQIMKENGINRISMGLQTTNNELLKKIGRIHTIEEFKENYKRAREEGFKNINIDIMFGLPNQSFYDYKETLEDIVKLDPEHISCYSLIIEEGTPFYNMSEKGLLKLPSEEEERDMYSVTKNILEKNGYHQYEISNYSKKNKECINNKIYWECKEYLGVGVSASSYINEERIKNIDDIKTYIKKINNNEEVYESIINNTEKEDMEEFMFLGLRMIKGISKEEFKKRFNKNIEDVYGKVIMDNINKGLLKDVNSRIFLTDKGIELSNWVMSEFIL